jgi:hypothetical protein
LLRGDLLRWLRRLGQTFAREQPVNAVWSNHGIPQAAGNHQQHAEGRQGRTIRRPAAVNNRFSDANGRSPDRLDGFLERVRWFSLILWKTTVPFRGRNEL